MDQGPHLKPKDSRFVLRQTHPLTHFVASDSRGNGTLHFTRHFLNASSTLDSQFFD
jgi:hypothetical protein